MSVSAVAEVIGTWRLFSCYTPVEDIMPTGKVVYVKANGGLFSYRTSDGTVTEHNKLNGLTSQNISMIQWCAATRKLVIVYDDYTIDLLGNDGDDVETINAIKDKVTTYDKTINAMYVNGQYVYLCTAFGLVKLNTKDATVASTYNLSMNVSDMSIRDGSIYVLTDKGIYSAASKANLIDKNAWTLTDTEWSSVSSSRKTDRNEHGIIIADEYNRNTYWGSDASGKLASYTKEGDAYRISLSGIAPDGPPTSDVWRIYKHNGILFCTAGAFAYDVYKYNPGMIYYLSGDDWHILDAPDAESLGYKYLDANVMAFDPKNHNHFYVGARSGLYEYSNMKCIRAFTVGNSTLTGLYNGKSKENALISGMTVDADGTLWINNGWTDTPIQRFSSWSEGDDAWKSYQHSTLQFTNKYAIDLQGAFISRTNGMMWFVNHHFDTQALFRYDYLNNKLTRYTETINQDGTKMDVHYTYCTAEDHDGNVWIGTDAGPAYLSAKDIKNGGTALTQHKVARNDGTGLADYLLNKVAVKYIAIDAANRKWMGAVNDGVYLISDDNDTEIAHFTTENSPLLSNVIYSITVDDETGWVYFATDRGLCAYMADVRKDYGSDLSSGNIYAYPNPVTPDYTGMITITGITQKSTIKITNAAGYVVNSGTTTSGSYQWDGCDTTGRRVASGIYKVFIANEDASGGCVTQIAVVR